MKNACTSGPYIYAPLGETSIRLIRLIGRTPEGLIDCRLEQFELEATPCYRALSYHWGSPLLTRIICLGGKLHLLHESLWQFFDQMVSDGRLGYYWTDALCINQRNVHERNHQVGCMDEIYRHAEEVIIWLGRKEQTQSAMWLIVQFSRYHDETRQSLGEDVNPILTIDDHRTGVKLKGFIDVLQEDEMIKYVLPYVRDSTGQTGSPADSLNPPSDSRSDQGQAITSHNRPAESAILAPAMDSTGDRAG